MVSEDSQDLRWFSMIHRLRDLRNLNDARHRKVPTEFHQLNDLYELLEVLLLRSSQRVLPEEWNDRLSKVADPLHAIPIHVFSVIVAPAVSVHLAASEEFHELFQNASA